MLSKSHQQSEPAIYYYLTNAPLPPPPPAKEASNSNHFICQAHDMGKSGFQIRVAKSCAGMVAIFSNTLFVCSPGFTPTRGFGLWVSNEVACMTWSESSRLTPGLWAVSCTPASPLNGQTVTMWLTASPHNHSRREEAYKFTSLQSYQFKSTNPAYL